jgi:hypothetical protein
MLVIAWIVAALRHRGPFPILVIKGEAGTGKSLFSRIVRSLVDPSVSASHAGTLDRLSNAKTHEIAGRHHEIAIVTRNGTNRRGGRAASNIISSRSVCSMRVAKPLPVASRQSGRSSSTAFRP